MSNPCNTRNAAHENRFWAVFADRMHLTTNIRHSTREAAVKEATRLARANPGDRFYVAAFTGYAQVVDTPWFEMAKGE